jgi:hypothetical protein
MIFQYRVKRLIEGYLTIGSGPCYLDTSVKPRSSQRRRPVAVWPFLLSYFTAVNTSGWDGKWEQRHVATWCTQQRQGRSLGRFTCIWKLSSGTGIIHSIVRCEALKTCIILHPICIVCFVAIYIVFFLVNNEYISCSFMLMMWIYLVII